MPAKGSKKAAAPESNVKSQGELLAIERYKRVSALKSFLLPDEMTALIKMRYDDQTAELERLEALHLQPTQGTGAVSAAPWYCDLLSPVTLVNPPPPPPPGRKGGRAAKGKAAMGRAAKGGRVAKGKAAKGGGSKRRGSESEGSEKDSDSEADDNDLNDPELGSDGDGEGGGDGEEDSAPASDSEAEKRYVKQAFYPELANAIYILFGSDDIRNELAHKIDMGTFDVMEFLEAIENLRESMYLKTPYYKGMVEKIQTHWSANTEKVKTSFYPGGWESTLATVYVYGHAQGEANLKLSEKSMWTNMQPILDRMYDLTRLAQLSLDKKKRVYRRRVGGNPGVADDSAAAGAGPSGSRGAAPATSAPASLVPEVRAPETPAPSTSASRFTLVADLPPERQQRRAAKFVALGYPAAGTGCALLDFGVQLMRLP
jgi:hypothetical protein